MRRKQQSSLATRTKTEILKIRNCRLWRNHVRVQQLIDFPWCQKCYERAKLTPAQEVDHIIPLEEGGEAFDPKNLKSLCKRCHVIKSAEEARNRAKKKNKLNRTITLHQH
ncbi:HNH endonuclease signature motif containing protein [Dyadobacter chenwenxiniae]|uniref:HNH endonuclease signature motif containing protein n=1 Tax=Dyadobacter chenwenxiniae TaxID=2906456 RepID=UPI0035B69399